jgi:TRAP-type C4-dicarboxylate transport system permease small subunit
MLSRFVQSASNGLAIVAGAATVLTMSIVTVDVTLRFFGSGVPGTLEIVTYYLMLVVAFLPLAYVERQDAVISVDALYVLAPPGAKRAMDIFVGLFSFLVYSAIAYLSLLEALRKFSSGSYVMTAYYELPVWPAYFIVPVGFGLAAIVVLHKTFARRPPNGPVNGNV